MKFLRVKQCFKALERLLNFPQGYLLVQERKTGRKLPEKTCDQQEESYRAWKSCVSNWSPCTYTEFGSHTILLLRRHCFAVDFGVSEIVSIVRGITRALPFCIGIFRSCRKRTEDQKCYGALSGARVYRTSTAKDIILCFFFKSCFESLKDTEFQKYRDIGN